MHDVPRCGRCGAEILPSEDRCPACGEPWRPRPVGPGGAGENELVACPECAEPIRSMARRCRFCGYDVEHGARAASRGPSGARAFREAVDSRSPAIAGILAFFFPGLGHIYVGRIARGLAFMLIPSAVFTLVALGGMLTLPERTPSPTEVVGSFAVFFVVGTLVYLWQILDAVACARVTQRRD